MVYWLVKKREVCRHPTRAFFSFFLTGRTLVHFNRPYLPVCLLTNHNNMQEGDFRRRLSELFPYLCDHCIDKIVAFYSESKEWGWGYEYTDSDEDIFYDTRCHISQICDRCMPLRKMDDMERRLNALEEEVTTLKTAIEKKTKQDEK